MVALELPFVLLVGQPGTAGGVMASAASGRIGSAPCKSRMLSQRKEFEPTTKRNSLTNQLTGILREFCVNQSWTVMHSNAN
jgi:hypothetical protein